MRGLMSQSKPDLTQAAPRAEYEAKYTAERNYQMLMDIYEKLVNSS